MFLVFQGFFKSCKLSEDFMLFAKSQKYRTKSLSANSYYENWKSDNIIIVWKYAKHQISNIFWEVAAFTRELDLQRISLHCKIIAVIYCQVLDCLSNFQSIEQNYYLPTHITWTEKLTDIIIFWRLYKRQHISNIFWEFAAFTRELDFQEFHCIAKL